MFILLIPITWIVWSTTTKVLDICFLHRNDFVFTCAALTKNTCKKYGGGANFNISYKGQTAEGSDGCMLWASKGDEVRVYFHKMDLYNNGIVSELIILSVGRWSIFLLLAGCFIWRMKAFYQLKKGNAEREADL